MTDLLFADCCYGSEFQHGNGQPCPQTNEIIIEARRRAAEKAVYPLNKENILRGKWDNKSSVIRARRAVERETLLAHWLPVQAGDSSK